MADRTRDPTIIAFAQRQVTLTDFVFTAGGVALILATGAGNAVLHNISTAGNRAAPTGRRGGGTPLNFFS
jgi:catechol 2,3-dioxygenase-like lactoylglutathione lyase family enzyme